MLSQTKELILKALRKYQGDDYARAKVSFSSFTKEELKEPFGNSGQTRGEVLEGYERHHRAVERAIAEVEALKEV